MSGVSIQYFMSFLQQTHWVAEISQRLRAALALTKPGSFSVENAKPSAKYLKRLTFSDSVSFRGLETLRKSSPKMTCSIQMANRA